MWGESMLQYNLQQENWKETRGSIPREQQNKL